MNRLEKTYGEGTPARDGSPTKSEVIKSWFDPTAPKTVFGKVVLLTCVGKSSIQYTPKSALVHCFLSNGTDVFRLVVWHEQYREVRTLLKLNHTLLITQLKVTGFFKDKSNPCAYPASLCQLLDLTLSGNSTVYVRENKAFEEYPAKNEFPPFWRDLSDICTGEIELAMRVLILEETNASKFKVDGKQIDGVTMVIGDRKTKKATVYLCADMADSKDKEIVDEFKVNEEIYIFGAQARSNAGNVALLIRSVDTIYPIEEKTMDRKESYAEVKLKEKPHPPPSNTPAKKARVLEY